MNNIYSSATLADKILFVFLLVVSLSGIFIVREAVPEAGVVLIELDGKRVFTAPLSRDRKVKLEGLYGNIEVEIKTSKVRILEVHCPNQLCLKEGWLSQGVLVCLPNKLVVFVGGRGKQLRNKPDAVTG